MIEDFLEFELRNNCFHIEINNVKIWHLIRVDIYKEIVNKNEKVPKAHNASVYKNKTKLIVSKIKQLSNYWSNNPYRNLKEKDLLILNHSRRVKDNDTYLCLYTSDLITNLDNRYYVYEGHYQEMHFQPVPEKNIKYTDIIINKYLAMRIANRLFNIKNLSNEDIKKIEKLIHKICLEFHVELNFKK